MEINILIISQGSSFMTNALVSSLRKAEFNCTVVEPDIKKIGAARQDTDIYIFYAGEFIVEQPEILVYMKDVCAEEEKPFCMIGYENEITEIRETIPENYITREFKRPFDMKNLTNSLITLAEADEERKKGRHILLVDDDPVFLKMMQDWLSMKYNITSVRSGMQAITYIATHKPDLILLDYDMPVTPGPQVMEMIRQEHNADEIPIIFLTAKSDTESVISVMQLRPQGYLLKSMSKEEIVEAVDHFFETNKWKNFK